MEYKEIWAKYIEYLCKWTDEKADPLFAGMSPAPFDEWRMNELSICGYVELCPHCETENEYGTEDITDCYHIECKCGKLIMPCDMCNHYHNHTCPTPCYETRQLAVEMLRGEI